MRRGLFALLVAFAAPAAALAEDEPGHGSPAASAETAPSAGHADTAADHAGAVAGHHGEAVCDAAASDEACLEAWEENINWWSWDYRPGPEQRPEHRHMPPPFGFALINFAVFAAIMYRLAGRPLIEFVATRHLTIKHDLDEAARLRREADVKLREYENKIANLDAEVESLIAQVRAEAEAEKARLVAAAAAQAQRLRSDAAAQIENERQQLRKALRRESVNAALVAAEKLLRQQWSDADQRREGERYLQELEARNPAARS